MSHAIRILVVAAFAACATPALSVDLINRAEAEELFSISGFERTILDMKESCVLQMTSAWGSPAAVAKRGEKFYGRTPSSPDWASILRFYEEYANRACSHPTIKEWKELFVSFYSANLTQSTYSSYRTFLQSSQGKEIVRLQLAFYKDWASQMANNQSAAAAGAYERFLEQTKLTAKN